MFEYVEFFNFDSPMNSKQIMREKRFYTQHGEME